MEATGQARRDGFDKPLAVAIFAMGGQGGGTLCDWIVAAAEHEGWVAQSTSVPGVAQRTGATIYYVEMLTGIVSSVHAGRRRRRHCCRAMEAGRSIRAAS